MTHTNRCYHTFYFYGTVILWNASKHLIHSPDENTVSTNTLQPLSLGAAHVGDIRQHSSRTFLSFELSGMQRHTDSYNPMMQLVKVFHYYFITETVVCLRRERNGCVTKKKNKKNRTIERSPNPRLPSHLHTAGQS